MEDENLHWAVIHDFPTYEVSNTGIVVNRMTGRVMKQSKTQAGQVKVGLVDEDGVQRARSVKTLVADAFVDGKDHIRDTAIHLDGNPENNHADNLVWRPRWFALRWARQFTEIERGEYQFYFGHPIYECNTRTYYDNIHHAAITNGSLHWEIFISAHNLRRTWPDGKRFRFVDDDRLGPIGSPDEFIHK